MHAQSVAGVTVLVGRLLGVWWCSGATGTDARAYIKCCVGMVQSGCEQRSSLFPQGYPCDLSFLIILEIFEFIICTLTVSL